jgi:hypothetical protein
MLVIFSVAVLSRLVDRYYVHVFEPDAQGTVDLVLAVASGEAFLGRPQPGRFPPYFDAQYYLYAVAYYVARSLRWMSLVSPDATPTPQSVATLAIRYANVAAYSVSVGTGFLLFRELSGRTSIALLLALYLLFSPHMLNIDFMRVDHLVLTLFLINFYLTLQVAKRECGIWLHVLLGGTTAALCLTKVTSVVFLSVPLMGYGNAICKRGLLTSGAVPWMAAFVGSAFFFFARFLPHEIAGPGFTFDVAQSKLDEINAWAAVYPVLPRFFYNWNQFESYGLLFLAVLLVSATVVLRRVFGRAPGFPGVLIVGLVGALSLAGYFSFKYPRGLYVLLPLYLAAVASAFSIRESHGKGGEAVAGEALKVWSVVRGIGWLALLAGLAWPIAAYQRAAESASSRQAAISVTKLQPRDWLSAHLWSGARMTIPRHSEWASPPLEGLGYDIAYRFLDFPYLESAKLARYRPPSLQQVEESTDVIILNDYHLNMYLQALSTAGGLDLRREWQEFFDLLRRTYPVKRFEAATPAYDVRAVEVVVVHASRK